MRIGIVNQIVSAEANGQKEQSRNHQSCMEDPLRRKAADADQSIGIEVSRQQHQLEEQNRRRPHRCAPAEKREDHLPDQWLEAEEKKGAQHQCRHQQESYVVRNLQHAVSLTKRKSGPGRLFSFLQKWKQPAWPRFSLWNDGEFDPSRSVVDDRHFGASSFEPLKEDRILPGTRGN